MALEPTGVTFIVHCFLANPIKQVGHYGIDNVETHELGLSLIRPGVACSTICDELNRYFLTDQDLLLYCSFGYGHADLSVLPSGLVAIRLVIQ